jgi:hypothetical protein
MAENETPDPLLPAPLLPAPARARRPIQLASARVCWTHPGLGRALAQGAVGIFAAAVLSMRISGATDVDFTPGVRSILETCTIVAYLLTPALAVLSVLASHLSLPRPSWAVLSVSEEGLLLTRGAIERLIPKSRIAEGALIPSKPTARVDLRLRDGGLITAEAENEEEARELLSALGLGAAERKATIELATPGQMLTGGCLGAVVSIVAAVFLYVVIATSISDRAATIWMDIGSFFLIALGAIAGGYLRGGRKEIVIGADGVRIPGRLRARFIPYSKITWVTVLDGHLMLRLREEPEGSSVVKVAVWVPSDSELEGATRRIREAMAASWARPLGAEGLAALEPRGRPLSDWREALRSLVRRSEAYRHAQPLAEDLLAVLADPNAPPPRRIGAALALRATEDPEAPAKILAAADGCARDRLRVALEQAAGDDLHEEALREALAEAEQEEAAARAGRPGQ